MFNPVPKPNFNRRTPKRANRGRFSKQTIQNIKDRDNGLCVRCGAQAVDIHHVIFKSQGGLGTEDNGVCVCRKCHDWAHQKREGRKWFEDYRNQHLLGQIEIHERMQDCEICGFEINHRKEEYYREYRVCPRCHFELTGGARYARKSS